MEYEERAAEIARLPTRAALQAEVQERTAEVDRIKD